MATYFKDNFEWDFGMYLSQIHLVSSKVNESIKKFSECLSSQNEETTKDIEIIEDFGSVEINPDLSASLISLFENLKNEAFYNSLLISSYSFLEFSVIEYCRLIEVYLKKNIRLAKINKIGLFKAQKFLRKAVGLDISTLPAWKDIEIYRKHRNIVIHNYANIIQTSNKPIEKQNDYNVLHNIANLEITSAGYIFITNIDYINNLLDISSGFLSDIIENTKKTFTNEQK